MSATVTIETLDAQVVVSTTTVTVEQATTGPQGPTGATGPSGVIAVTSPITNSGTSTSANIGIDQTLLTISESQVTNLTTDLASKIPSTEKAAANGVASLDANGLIPNAQLPALAITDTFVVASQSAMLALTAQVGDVAVRTDVSKSYILTATPASTIGNWQELLTPPDAVTSVNGKVGVVSLTYTDVGADAAGAAAAVTTTSIGAVPTSRTVSTTSPLAGGGALSGDLTLSVGAGSTTTAGVVQLEDSTTSTSTSKAATPNSVKSAYDLAAGKVASVSGTAPIASSGGTTPAISLNLGSGVTTSGSNLVVDGTVVPLLAQENTFTKAPQQVTINAAGNKGLIIKGASSQTANLTEWQDSTGAVAAKVDSIGSLTAANMTTSGTLNTNFLGVYAAATTSQQALLNTGTAARIVLVVKGAASQSANLQEWQNSSGTVLANIASSGQLNANSGLYGNWIGASSGRIGTALLSVFTGYLANPGIVVRGAASQTADLLQNLTSASTVLGGANALSQMYTGSASTLTQTTGGATTAASGDGTTATITTTSAHGLAVGDLVTVAGVTPTGYNGTYLVTATPSSTQISYANATTGAQTVAGTVAAPAQLSVTARSAGTTGVIVRAAASQVASLLTLQNSSGTTVFTTAVSGATTIQSKVYVIASDYGAALNVRTFSTSTPGIIVQALASQTGDLQQWQNSSATVLAKVNASGDVLGTTHKTLNSYAVTAEANSGGQLTMTKETTAATNPGSGNGTLYFRDGTNAGTLKLVVRAGTAGAETTILDNIPQT